MASNRDGSSGPQDSGERASRSGTKTAEYKKVKANMGTLIQTIEVTPKAVASLTTKFVEKEWLAAHAKDITANELIILVLNRIKNNADEHESFIEMLRDTTGLNQVVTFLTVIQEESDSTHLSADTQSSDHSAKDPSKHAIVSGSNVRRLANRAPMGPNQENKPLQLEPDSGVPNDPGTLDTCTKQMGAEQQSERADMPTSPPPGSLPPVQVAPPILKNGASVNYIPHNDHGIGTDNDVVESEGSEGQDGDTNGQEPMIPKGNGKRITTTTNIETPTSAGETEAQVPTSSGSVNSIAQQPAGMRKLDVEADTGSTEDKEEVEYPPSASACDVDFTIGREADTDTTEDQEEEEHNGQATFSNPPMAEVSKQSQSEEELAQDTAYFLSASSRMINQLEGLKAQNTDLRRQLSEEQVAKEVLRQEKEILSNQFNQYQRSARAKEEAANNELEKKEQQLAECKLKLSEMEREKRKIESECQKNCTKLQEGIDLLRKQIEDDKKNTELETLRLENKLYKAEKLLSDKENVILTKEKTIAELEKKISIDNANLKIQKLEKENRELKERRRQSVSSHLSHHFSSLEIECPERNSSDEVLKELPH